MSNNRAATVISLIIVSLAGIAGIIFGIDYFGFEPSGIIPSKSEISFGASSKLGWALTFSFFILYMLFLLIRRVYLKLTGQP
jgi:hypothetical protein